MKAKESPETGALSHGFTPCAVWTDTELCPKLRRRFLWGLMVKAVSLCRGSTNVGIGTSEPEAEIPNRRNLASYPPVVSAAAIFICTTGEQIWTRGQSSDTRSWE